MILKYLLYELAGVLSYMLHINTHPKEFKVFPSTNCPYHGVKIACLGISVKSLTREFSTFALKSLQNNTYRVIGKLNDEN